MNLIRITRAVSGDSISAICPVPAPQGTLVNFDPANPAQYRLVTGKRGFLLERDVLDPTSYDTTILKDDVFMDNLVPPIKQGLEVSARKVEEAEVEGDGGLILPSGTGAITSATAADTELSSNNGMFSVRQNGQELVGWLRAQLTPQDPANGCRIRVEFAG